MTNDELRELREWAAKVCGYEMIQLNANSAARYTKEGREIFASTWLPDQNISQAFECLDAIMASAECPHFDLHCMSPSRRWSAHIEFGFEKKNAEAPGGHANHESLPMALLLACKAAHEAINRG